MYVEYAADMVLQTKKGEYLDLTQYVLFTGLLMHFLKLQSDNLHSDLLPATCITKDHYVDDLSTGGSLSEVDRFKGKSTIDLQQGSTIPQILVKGSLQVSSGESNPLHLKRIDSKYLVLTGTPK